MSHGLRIFITTFPKFQTWTPHRWLPPMQTKLPLQFRWSLQDRRGMCIHGCSVHKKNKFSNKTCKSNFDTSQDCKEKLKCRTCRSTNVSLQRFTNGQIGTGAALQMAGCVHTAEVTILGLSWIFRIHVKFDEPYEPKNEC
jgi:hypothetical protein